MEQLSNTVKIEEVRKMLYKYNVLCPCCSCQRVRHYVVPGTCKRMNLVCTVQCTGNRVGWEVANVIPVSHIRESKSCVVGSWFTYKHTHRGRGEGVERIFANQLWLDVDTISASASLHTSPNNVKSPHCASLDPTLEYVHHILWGLSCSWRESLEGSTSEGAEKSLCSEVG